MGFFFFSGGGCVDY